MAPADEKSGAGRIAEEARSAGALLLANPAQDSKQIDSLRVALRSLDSGVDAIVVPGFGGRRGHPALFGRESFEALLEGHLPEGARTVIDRYEDRVVEIAARDSGIMLNVETPAAYDAFLRRPGE